MYSYKVLTEKYEDIRDYVKFLVGENENLHKIKKEQKAKIEKLEKQVVDLSMLLQVKLDDYKELKQDEKR